MLALKIVTVEIVEIVDVFIIAMHFDEEVLVVNPELGEVVKGFKLVDAIFEDASLEVIVVEVLFETVSKAAQSVPRSAGFLKSSAEVPLVTPYFVPAAEMIVELPL